MKILNSLTTLSVFKGKIRHDMLLSMLDKSIQRKNKMGDSSCDNIV